ncbi:MAG: hypothetical protein ROW52_11040 [Anaerolineaceae bacterium]|jgi:hypothetical protein
MFINQISSKERQWIIGFAVVLLAVTCIPYWIAYARAAPDWRFTGFVFSVEDGNSYIAKMLSGAAGAWLFRTPYTAMEQQGFLAFLPYILLGKLTAPPAQHEQLVALFHLFRMLAGFCLIIATYDFLSLYLKNTTLRKLALVIVAAGGGIGWVLLFWQPYGTQRLPLEFYSPETFGFLSIYGIPHLAAARALLLWGLVLYLRPHEKETRFNPAVRGGLVWFLLGFFQPATVVIGWGVLAAHLAATGGLRWLRNRRTGLSEWGDWIRYFQRAVVMGMISLPIVFYTVVSFLTDPFLRGWASQNIILSPPPVDYLLAYGLFLPFSILGVRHVLKGYPLKGPLLAGWLLALPFLAYAPFNLQRRLVEGGWVVMVVLAFAFLDQHRRTGIIAAKILFTVSMIPSALLVTGHISLTAIEPPIYQRADTIAVFNFLAENARPGDVVLASYATSNPLPAWAPLRVVIGHGPESVGLAELQPRVARFFKSETPDQERIDLINDKNVRFIIYGPEERKLSTHILNAWNPMLAHFVEPIYAHGNYQVFMVKDLNDDTP